MGYYCVSNMRLVALQDTPLAWLKAGIGWHASTSRGSGRQGLAATYEKKRELAWIGGKAMARFQEQLMCAGRLRVMGESPRASRPDDGSAKLKPRVQGERARRVKVWEREVTVTVTEIDQGGQTRQWRNMRYCSEGQEKCRLLRGLT